MHTCILPPINTHYLYLKDHNNKWTSKSSVAEPLRARMRHTMQPLAGTYHIAISMHHSTYLCTTYANQVVIYWSTFRICYYGY